MAFSATIPTNDELLTNFPALCRANWDGIVLGTDANLLITNAKIAAGAGIAVVAGGVALGVALSVLAEVGAVPIGLGFATELISILGITVVKIVRNNRNAIFNPQPALVAHAALIAPAALIAQEVQSLPEPLRGG